MLHPTSDNLAPNINKEGYLRGFSKINSQVLLSRTRYRSSADKLCKRNDSIDIDKLQNALQRGLGDNLNNRLNIKVDIEENINLNNRGYIKETIDNKEDKLLVVQLVLKPKLSNKIGKKKKGYNTRTKISKAQQRLYRDAKRKAKGI